MKKKIILTCIASLLLITGCSSKTTELEQSPCACAQSKSKGILL